MEKTNKVSFKNKLFYGFGAIGISLIDAFFSNFLTLYVTDVLHIDALLFASILIGPKIVDMIIDIFIMYFVGKTKTKFGMYKPWLLNIIPICIGFVIIFSSPYFNMSTNWLLILIMVVYLFSKSICVSLYWIPYTAIAGVMSEDEDELVKISSYRTLFENLSYIVVSIITMPILLSFGSHKNPDGWLFVVSILAIVSLIASLLTFFGVKTNKELEEKFINDYSPKDNLNDYKKIIVNKNFVLTASILLLTYITSYIFSTVSYYFIIYNLNMENMIAYIAILGAVTTILCSFITNALNAKLGPKNSLILGTITSAVGCLLPIFATREITMMISVFLRSFGGFIMQTIIYSRWPLIAKELNNKEVKCPLNNTIALANTVDNIAILIGTTIGSAIITYSGYNEDLAIQSNFTLDIIRYVAPIVSVVLLIAIVIIVLLFYKKDTKTKNKL